MKRLKTLEKEFAQICQNCGIEKGKHRKSDLGCPKGKSCYGIFQFGPQTFKKSKKVKE
jgi:hypothetical protein